MSTTHTAAAALDNALALARLEGRPVRSIKDLLCDACGEAVALRAGGYCHRCADDLTAHYDARRAAADDGAAYLAAAYDDPETCAHAAGLHPGKC